MSAPDVDEVTAAMASSVLVEEPEDGDFAIEEDDDEVAKAAPSGSAGALLEPPSSGASPISTPSGSSADLALQPIASGATTASDPAVSYAPLHVPKQRRPSRSADHSPSRRGSVSQLLHRSSSFHKSLTRRLSSAERPSLPSRRSSQSAATTAKPPLSRASSLRLVREQQNAREAGTSGEAGLLDVPAADGHASGTSSPGEPAALGRVLDPPTPEADEVDAEKLAADERARESAAKAKRAEEEVARAVHEGRWSKRVIRKGAIFHAGCALSSSCSLPPRQLEPDLGEGLRTATRATAVTAVVSTRCALRLTRLASSLGPLTCRLCPSGVAAASALSLPSACGCVCFCHGRHRPFADAVPPAQLHHENISSALHGSPADAVDIHLDVRSRNTIGALHPLLCLSLSLSSRASRS